LPVFPEPADPLSQAADRDTDQLCRRQHQDILSKRENLVQMHCLISSGIELLRHYGSSHCMETVLFSNGVDGFQKPDFVLRSFCKT